MGRLRNPEVPASVWDKPDALDKLEVTRDTKRKKGSRLTFDCFNAVTNGERVTCKHAHVFRPKSSRDSSMPVLAILRGVTAGACRSCPDFEGD